MALNLEDLEAARCQEPGCSHEHGPVVLSGRCHRGAGVMVSFFPGETCVRISCNECGEPVADVEVARRTG